ncbi:sterol desaturase family protein [Candidatus Brachybacter algidus]|uniref:sterol desaturase family protein n=1 Tax=Candidatus Brachybacter algidus TaxID=2982024 RepID=UPI00338E35AD
MSKSKDQTFRYYIIVSPKMHRIHHSVTRTETDSNYSSVLPYWDILFGSYIRKVEEPIEFGINDRA